MGGLTQPQIAPVASLPDGAALVGDGKGSPLVERPDRARMWS
jgi:hypothetical protein